MADGIIEELVIQIKSMFDDKGLKKAKKGVDDLKKPVDNAGKSVNKLDQFLKSAANGGFKGMSKEMLATAGRAGLVIGAAVGIGVAAVKAAQALDRMADSMARNNQAFTNFNRQTGLSISSLNRIAGVGMLSDYNFTAENAMQGLFNLQSKLAEIRLTGQGVAPFQMLGISPVGKNAEQVIEDLRTAIKGIDDMTAVNLIQQMGLSPEFLTMLRLSREEYQAMQEQAKSFQLDANQRKELQKYSLELKKIHMQSQYLSDVWKLKFLPATVAIQKVFLDINQLGMNFVNAIEKLSVVLTPVFKAFEGIFALVKWIVYAIDDLLVWLTGGKSVLGEKIGDINEHPAIKTFLTGGNNANFANPAMDAMLYGLNKDFMTNLLRGKPMPAVSNSNRTSNVTQNNYFNMDENSSPRATSEQIAGLLFANHKYNAFPIG